MNNKNLDINYNELHKKIEPIIIKLEQEYDFIGLSKEKFYNLINNEIKQCINLYNKNLKIPFDTFFEDRLILSLNRYIKETIKKTKSIDIINNYITKYINNTNNFNLNLLSLKKLNDFFNNINYIPTIDICIKIINLNEQLRDLLQNIVNHKNIENLISDDISVAFIDAYCTTNNINLNDINDCEINDDSLDFGYSENIVTTYLHEIDQPLLTCEEEKELAIQISLGNKQAKNLFIERNLRLVVSIAKRYLGQGLSLMDLIQEGNLGLMVAVDRFDVKKGYKFSSYATHWIKQSIILAIAKKGRNIRIPAYLNIKIGNFKENTRMLEKKLNREPTIDEIANELNISLQEATKLNKLLTDTISLNYLIGDSEEDEFEDFILTNDSLEDSIISNMIPNQIQSLLEECNLTERELLILTMHFGLNDNKPISGEKIGKMLGITRERVRQILNKTLLKIRKSKNIIQFAELTENPEHSLNSIEKLKNIKK